MLKILQTDGKNQNMKTKKSNLTFLILLILCNVFVLKAQDDDAPPPVKKSANNKSQTVEAAKYYFVFRIDADSKYTLTIQNDENAGAFGNLSDKSVVTDFLSALKNSDEKSKSNSFVIIKTDENVNYGTLTDFLQRARVLSNNQIKIYSSKNTFESFILVAKKPGPKDKPNPLTLIAEIKTNGKISLNMEEKGSLNDLSKLKNTLIPIFKEREEFGAYREGTNEVEKTVSIKAPSTMQFSEIIILIKALQETGAQPIELLIDDPKFL